MNLPIAGYALGGLTVVMVLIFIALVVSLVRGSSLRRRVRESGAETAWMSAALQEAITKLKVKEREMAARADASERLSGQIIAGLTSGLMVVDRDASVQTINPAARRILGLPDLPGPLPLREALKAAAPLADVIAETLGSGQPVVRRTVSVATGERPAHFGVTVSPITDAHGAIQAAVCLFTDLTEVVELEEQLRLKDALAQLGELTAGLAHEFRNGLATIHGYARLMDPATFPDAQRKCVEGIRQETAALGQVVTNFLNFARPERLTLVEVDLGPIVRRAIEDVDAGGGRIEIEGEFGAINGDEVLLRQALSNLVRNGVEAAIDAGRPPVIRVVGAVDEEVVRITVEDNGPGVPAAQAARIFQPFVTTKAYGTGLGLAIVQKVVVSHNGRIAFVNRSEGGAQFRLQIPRLAPR
jgi:nitrogen fixation/metabolism regulation signal transduction histidine kinase